MTDDLVKRLRQWDHCWPARWLEGAVSEAADRIEGLGAQLTQVMWERDEFDFLLNEGGPDSVANVIARAERAEAKLAEAVEALRFLEIAATGAGVPHPQERKLLHETILKARAVLAEIEPEVK